MSLPDDGIPGAQALKQPAQSSTEPSLKLELALKDDPQTEAQLEPRGVQSAKCEYFPATEHWTMMVDFLNWDPKKDVEAVKFERGLGEKFGKDVVYGFRWKRLPPNTRFVFHIPYPGHERERPYPKMEKLVSEAIYEYSGKAGIRTTCWHV